MNIISFHDGHTATASLFCSGVLEACVSEERFSRKKCHIGYPYRSIEYCMSVLGDRNLDQVLVIGKRPPDPMHIRTSHTTEFSVKDLVEIQYGYFKKILIDNKPQNEVYKEFYSKLFAERNFPETGYDIDENTKWTYDSKLDSQIFRKIQIQTIERHLSVQESQIKFIEHHPAHAAYAYYASNFREDDCLVFTMDGSGEGINATISIAHNDKVEEVYRTSDCGIGRLWKYITLLLAMTPDQHEFKVMGLAPYAGEKYGIEVLKLFKNNFLHIDGLDFKYKNKPKDIYFSFKDLLEGYRFDSIAAGLQLYTEQIVSEWIRNTIKKYKISRVVFSGGVAMNIKLNKVIASLEEVKEFYVAPSGGDESLPIGAFYKTYGNNQTKSLQNIYLGTCFSEQEILNEVNKYNNQFQVKMNPSPKEVAKLLADSNIVARFDDQMEFGARALGNRSILGNPSKIETMKKINSQVKSRDFWMPFTTTILDYREKDYIINEKNILCPFMSIAFESTDLARDHLKSAIHPYDYTVRPQILSKDQNLKYFELIQEFENITGIGAILNTSFNLHGEPVVNNPADALKTFSNSKIDVLLIGNVLIKRKSH
jgi:carbamoyltransferase